ncbi:MAG TPA: peptidoglycan-binding domain-containing protein [Candidatus Paceibacterota bacterium]
MTHLLPRRAAFFTGFILSSLLVLTFAFAAQVRADNEDVITPDGDNGANAGQVVSTSTTATSTDGTGGQHDVGGTVITGDATASTSVDNTLNINDVDPDTACNPTSAVDDEQCTNSSTILATSTNDAVASTTASSSAATGQNTAQGGQGLATVVTGKAMAFANVINLINTNIFNSTGLLLFLNQIFSTGLDLRDYNLSYFFDGEAGSSPTVNEDTGEEQCTILTCLNSSTLAVESGNTATVTNSVIVRADAGGNMATTSDDGDAYIDTGDAYAAANVVNLVNTNIINSSYLLVSFNNFGDLDGDITLPGGSFFTDLFARGGSAPEMNSSSYGVYNDNFGTTTGTTTAGADTGTNTASTTGEGSGIIATGDAYSQANEFTDLNKNYVGGTSAFFMFRVAGEWLGNVKSLPDGLGFYKMYDVAQKDGIVSTSTLVLVTTEDALDGAEEGLQDPEGTPTANCDEEDGPINNCFNSSDFVASSTNIAVVDNNIDVGANTGGNFAMTEDGTAHIITGDAYAIANVVNIINTNIVGRNWIFALFNVLGNWHGDISFGKSELALVAQAVAQGTVTPGSTVAYEFTITNNGDRDADDILLKADFDKSLLSFTDADGSATDSGREWRVPTVRRGESATFTYSANVGSIPAGTQVTVPLAASVLSDGANAMAQASFTLATLSVVSAPSGGGGGGGGGSKSSSKIKASQNSSVVSPTSSKNPEITVVKEVTRIGTTTPTIVDYKVVITNNKKAGNLYDGKLSDVLFDPSGAVMYERAWDIGPMAAGEQITLTYSVEFATSTAPGTYRNVATITGKRLGSGIEGKAFDPVEGVGAVTFGSAGAVLGAAVDCSLAVTQTLRRGMVNAEVAKLQLFLNTQGAALPGTMFFGPLTDAAVRAFQAKYAADILAPIGLTYPTGMVGSMTINKIKALTCAGSAATASQ